MKDVPILGRPEGVRQPRFSSGLRGRGLILPAASHQVQPVLPFPFLYELGAEGTAAGMSLVPVISQLAALRERLPFVRVAVSKVMSCCCGLRRRPAVDRLISTSLGIRVTLVKLGDFAFFGLSADDGICVFQK